jgi:hypothetical protein
MKPSLSKPMRRRALILLAALMLPALAGGCKKKLPHICGPVPLTAPWKDMGLPLGDVQICASNSEGFEGAGQMPIAWPVLAHEIHEKLEKDGWTSESGPEIDKTGFGARMRKGDKGLLFLVDAVPGDKVNRPFTMSLKKTWPAGKPSAEW